MTQDNAGTGRPDADDEERAPLVSPASQGSPTCSPSPPDACHSLNSLASAETAGRPLPGVAPSLLAVHGALVAVQVCFGANNVVGKLGLGAGTNPVFFALLREAVAGPVLLALAAVGERRLPQLRDAWAFAAAGLCMFANQLCFIVGLKLADNATTAALWQMTQPVFTTALALALRWERLTAWNAVGIAVSVAGACFVVAYGAAGSALSASVPANVCFFVNCLATSLYVIASKPLLKTRGYRPTTVIGWAYMVAATLMLAANAVVDFWPAGLGLMCPDCDGDAFRMSAKALAALASAIVLASLISYSLMTWANKWVDASVVSAYLVVQPLTTAVICIVLHAAGVRNMDKPGLNDLGAIPIVVGLGLIVYGQYRSKKAQEQQDKAAQQAQEQAAPQV
eukprot:m51a1_g10369 hypothetical protein (396) ;mRNA; r:92825-94196